MANPAQKMMLGEIELTRGLAILAVVLIHITGYPLRVFEVGSGGHDFYTLINRGMQFAVPLFLLISALVLSFQMSGPREVNWGSFYLKRWKRAVVPFVVWTTFYLAFRLFVVGDIPYFTLKQTILWYAFGKGFYHLYFLSVVIQLYFLFPLIHCFWQALRPGFLLTLIVFGSLQVAFYWANKLYIYEMFPYTGSIIFSYIFPIGIGLWLGYNTQVWAQWWKTWRPYILVVALSAGSFYISRQFAILAGERISTFYFQMAWALYVASLGVAVIFLTRRIAAGKGRFSGAITGWLNQVGRYSYGIYLIHPLILMIWQKLFPVKNALLVHSSVWVGFGVVVGIAGLLTYLLERTFLAGLLFGTVRKAKS